MNRTLFIECLADKLLCRKIQHRPPKKKKKKKERPLYLNDETNSYSTTICRSSTSEDSGFLARLRSSAKAKGA